MVAQYVQDEVSVRIYAGISHVLTLSVLFATNRLALNYKRLPYRVEYISYPDIEPMLKKLGFPPTSPTFPNYTLPSTSRGSSHF